MTIADLKDRASGVIETVRESPVVQRIEAWRYDPPAIGWKMVAFVFLVIVAAFFAGRWGVQRERDQWWRDQIALKSASVRAALERAAPDIANTDSLVLKALEESDDRLAAAEEDLRDARTRNGPDGCPRIPRQCLRH